VVLREFEYLCVGSHHYSEPNNRLRHSKIDWHLSEEEMLEKRLAWAKNSIKDIKRIEARYFEEN
jgi:hypothetical protein